MNARSEPDRHPAHRCARTWKAIEDFLLRPILIVIALPLIVVISVGVKLTSHGPVIYAQERVT